MWAGLSLLPATAGTKPVLAHYMPWYVARPFSATWGWHWTMNRFNPETTNAAGQRDIASHYHPLIGPYDSADPTVLEYHVLLMKLAGIDGVIVDWYGMDAFADYGVLNERTQALWTWVRRAGLKGVLCYEDRTIRSEIDGGFLAAAQALAHAQDTLRYAETNYLTDASYWRLGTQPVLLNFGPDYFRSSGQWGTIFGALQSSNRPALFTLNNRVTQGAGAFSWPPMEISQANGGVLTAAALENYLVDFEQRAKAWLGFVSSAFPRFHDIYAEAGVRPSYGLLADNDGATFEATLSRALTNRSAAVQLVTWNDFGEGTVIEPTTELGYRDLRLVQDLRRRYLDPAFPHGAGELELAARQYAQRREHRDHAIALAELDRVFANLVAGHLAVAGRQLAGLEEHVPVIYDLQVSPTRLEFTVGGYVPTAGLVVETATDVMAPAWSVVATSAGTTNLVHVQLPLAAGDAATFCRVRLLTPGGE